MRPEMVARKDASLHVSSGAKFICSLLGRYRFASGLPEAHVYLDPKLLEKYRVNLHLIEPNQPEREASREQMVSFASKKTADSNYLCTVFLQKPEDKMWAVSAYLMETYLGRYALRNNWYFRTGNYKAASRCFDSVVEIVNEVKEEMRETDTQQSRLPHLLKFKLSSVQGEIDEKSNSVAQYLSPDNVQPMADPREPYSTYLSTRSDVKAALEALPESNDKKKKKNAR